MRLNWERIVEKGVMEKGNLVEFQLDGGYVLAIADRPM